MDQFNFSKLKVLDCRGEYMSLKINEKAESLAYGCVCRTANISTTRSISRDKSVSNKKILMFFLEILMGKVIKYNRIHILKD